MLCLVLATRHLVAVLISALPALAWAGERCTAMDGATLQCGRERVKVEGLSAPELKAPGGQQARQLRIGQPDLRQYRLEVWVSSDTADVPP